MREIEDSLPGLLAARYTDWSIADRGAFFEATYTGLCYEGTGVRPVTATSAAALWVALDIADSAARAGMPGPGLAVPPSSASTAGPVFP